MQRPYLWTTPVWPYIAVVTCLFLLSVLALRSWTPRGDLVARRMDVIPGRSPCIDRADPPKEGVFLGDPRGSLESEGGRIELVALSEFDAPPQVAPLSPQVGEQKTPLSRSDVEMSGLAEPEAPPSTGPAQILAPTHSRALPTSGESLAPAVKPSEGIPKVAACWPYPGVLLGQLEELARFESSREWAEAAIDSFQRIHRAGSLSSPAVRGEFKALESLVGQAQSLAQATELADLRTKILRARYAVQRRMLVWGKIRHIVANGTDLHTVTVEDAGDISSHLDAVESRLASAVDADSWRRYLLLDELRLVARSGDAEQRQQLACRVLMRMGAPQLEEDQRGVLREVPFDGLSIVLRRWVSEPIDYLRLLDDVEVYEQGRSVEAARQLARCYQVIRWSKSEDVGELAELLNTHYRNANLRVTMAGTLINRLLPASYSFEEELQENILGARTSGTSRASARLRVALLPDGRRWRLGLEARGAVTSKTTTAKGPATFHNRGLSHYTARKLLFVDHRGIHTRRAQAEADSRFDLRRFETTYDPVPLIGWIARSIALQQHDNHDDHVQLQAAARLESIASDRLDREVHRKVAEVERDFHRQWLGPMKSLRLRPLALDMQTTDEQLVVRYRLAGVAQLGAHTPRPTVPSGSLLSVQIHESALTNTLEQLKLESKRTDLRALYRELADTFHRTDLEIPDDIPEGIIVQFADRDAVRLRCDDGRVTVTIRIAELNMPKPGASKRRRRYRGFAIRAYYIPDTNQLNANLVRDECIEVAGRRLNTLDRIALSAIFAKVLSRNRPFNIINKKLAEHPNLNDLHVTQFVINDGWIGVSLGPLQGVLVKRTADGNRDVRRQ